ncbi:2-oxo-4-hydroxy-4-carboxy-5-ureidoimidazoline decarboxylase [Streptomyces sp. NPDC054796]
MRLTPERSEHEPRSAGPKLAWLNTVPAAEAEEVLLRCCGSRRWAARVAAHRPYPDHEALLAASDEACYDLTFADLAEALAEETAHHPLSDQPGTLAAHMALRAAHAAYESRFGHAFLVCLDGYAAEERMDQALASVRVRLGNEVEREWDVTADELRALTRARLTHLLA